MGFLSNLFKKKEVVEETEEVEEVVEEPSYKPSSEDFIVCAYCDQEIFGDQRVKSWGGKKYHLKPCWRNLLKNAKQVHSGTQALPNT
jgi:hypothetical protein